MSPTRGMASDARTDCSTRAPTFSLTAVGEKWNCSFLPDLSLSEVADYLHSAILLNASEAGVRVRFQDMLDGSAPGHL
jgi:hypothetical protein